MQADKNHVTRSGRKVMKPSYNDSSDEENSDIDDSDDIS